MTHVKDDDKDELLARFLQGPIQLGGVPDELEGKKQPKRKPKKIIEATEEEKRRAAELHKPDSCTLAGKDRLH
jgi:hypothetical protein